MFTWTKNKNLFCLPFWTDFSFCTLIIFGNYIKNHTTFFQILATAAEKCWKGYLPNLLEITLLDQIFVFWVRDFNFWLLAYFLIFFTSANFQKDWTTFILDILQGSPLWILVDYKNKKHQRGDPYKMSNINVVQSFWNFAQLKKIKK